MKKCFKCGKEKDLCDFYVHPQMGDGHLNKCKDCTKKDTAKREKRIRSTPDGVMAERARHRDKYYRLKYKDKHKPTPERRKKSMERFYIKFPEKDEARRISSKIKAIAGLEKHHWSYNTEHYLNLIFLAPRDHSKLHRYMIYDQERMMYRTLDGVLLDTKERHLDYYNSIKNKP